MKGPYVIFCGGHSTLLRSKHYSGTVSIKWQIGEDSDGVLLINLLFLFCTDYQRSATKFVKTNVTQYSRNQGAEFSGFRTEKKNDTNQSDLRPSIKANISWIVLEARQAVNIWTLNTPFPLSSLMYVSAWQDNTLNLLLIKAVHTTLTTLHLHNSY